MGVEIERKFLVNKKLLPEAGDQKVLKQGYLNDDTERLVRIRTSDQSAFLTIKGRGTGISRPEYEYEIPINDANELMELAIYPPISKIRKLVYREGKKWEIDIFFGANEGLILAEIELDSEDEYVNLPEWIEKEVTGDKRYFNYELSKNPFCEW